MNLSNYLKSVIKELKLATFPTQSVVVNFTLFVILFTAVMAVFLGLLDLIFGGATLKFVEMMKGGQAISPAISEIATTTNNILNATTSTETLLK